MNVKETPEKSSPRKVPRLRHGVPRRASGFTLTELIAVFAIIAILAVAVLGVTRYAMKKARSGKAKGTLYKLSIAIGLYEKDFGAFVPDSVETENGDSLRYVLGELRWTRNFTDALGHKRSRPSINDYDKSSEILFFFLQDMYDVMNSDQASRGANKSFLATLPRKEAYVKFKRNELADTDGDALPEIVDGWGIPFLYVAADESRDDSVINLEPHAGKNPESYSLYSFGPDRLGYYNKTTGRGEHDYPVGDLDFDGKTDGSDQAEMEDRIRDFAQAEGYGRNKAVAILNKDNVTNWGREE